MVLLSLCITCSLMLEVTILQLDFWLALATSTSQDYVPCSIHVFLVCRVRLLLKWQGAAGQQQNGCAPLPPLPICKPSEAAWLFLPWMEQLESVGMSVQGPLSAGVERLRCLGSPASSVQPPFSNSPFPCQELPGALPSSQRVKAQCCLSC